MPALIRTLQLALAAVLLVSISDPVASAMPLASPHPYPMPFREADYRGHLPSISHATLHKLVKRSRPDRSALVNDAREEGHSPVLHTTANSPAVSRDYVRPLMIKRAPYERISGRQEDSASMDALLNEMGSNSDAMSSSSGSFQNLASQSAGAPSSSFQSDALAGLTGYKTSLQAAVDILSQLAADKGLANYDKTDELETMLKDIVNMNKNMLSDVTTMTYNIPALGSTLGPVMYEIKCLIDQTLDIVENVTDGLLNALKPSLEALLGQVDGICTSQVKLLGLCL